MPIGDWTVAVSTAFTKGRAMALSVMRTDPFVEVLPGTGSIRVSSLPASMRSVLPLPPSALMPPSLLICGVRPTSPIHSTTVS